MDVMLVNTAASCMEVITGFGITYKSTREGTSTNATTAHKLLTERINTIITSVSTMEKVIVALGVRKFSELKLSSRNINKFVIINVCNKH